MENSLFTVLNPIGAHSSGLIGENPKGSPNNIFPHLIRVASRKDSIFHVFGETGQQKMALE